MMPGLADAIDREAAWLATSGDSLPALLVSAGGKWDVVQADWPGSRLDTSLRGIYVTETTYLDQMLNGQRVRGQHTFRLKVVWTVRTSVPPIAENEQKALRLALADVVARVRGPFGDKTHGSRFLSAAQVPTGRGWPKVTLTDPEQTLPARYLRAVVDYMADDDEIIG